MGRSRIAIGSALIAVLCGCSSARHQLPSLTITPAPQRHPRTVTVHGSASVWLAIDRIRVSLTLTATGDTALLASKALDRMVEALQRRSRPIALVRGPLRLRTQFRYFEQEYRRWKTTAMATVVLVLHTGKQLVTLHDQLAEMKIHSSVEYLASARQGATSRIDRLALADALIRARRLAVDLGCRAVTPLRLTSSRTAIDRQQWTAGRVRLNGQVTLSVRLCSAGNSRTTTPSLTP